MSQPKKTFNSSLKEIVERKLSANNHTTAEKIKNRELAQKRESEAAQTSDHLDNRVFKITRIGSNRGK